MRGSARKRSGRSDAKSARHHSSGAMSHLAMATGRGRRKAIGPGRIARRAIVSRVEADGADSLARLRSAAGPAAIARGARSRRASAGRGRLNRPAARRARLRSVSVQRAAIGHGKPNRPGRERNESRGSTSPPARLRNAATRQAVTNRGAQNQGAIGHGAASRRAIGHGKRSRSPRMLHQAPTGVVVATMSRRIATNDLARRVDESAC